MGGWEGGWVGVRKGGWEVILIEMCLGVGGGRGGYSMYGNVHCTKL